MPFLPDYKSLLNCADVFATPDSGGKGRILVGPQSWTGVEYVERVEALLGGDKWVVNLSVVQM